MSSVHATVSVRYGCHNSTVAPGKGRVFAGLSEAKSRLLPVPRFTVSSAAGRASTGVSDDPSDAQGPVPSRLPACFAAL